MMTRLIRVCAALAISAVLFRHVHSALSNGQTFVNYLGYLTVWSNLSAIVVLIALGISPRLSMSRPFTWCRGAMTLSMCATALFFVWITASPVEAIKHAVAPLIALVDWLRDPPRNLDRWAPMKWFVGPVVYLAYTLIRGAETGWYPYKLLDPNEAGYTRVAVLVGAMLFALALAAVLLGRWDPVHRAKSGDRPAHPRQTGMPEASRVDRRQLVDAGR